MPPASINGTPYKPAAFLLFTATPAAGLCALHFASTANLESRVLRCRIAQRGWSTACFHVRYALQLVWMDATIVWRWYKWLVVKEWSLMRIWLRMRNTWGTRWSSLWVFRRETNRSGRWTLSNLDSFDLLSSHIHALLNYLKKQSKRLISWDNLPQRQRLASCLQQNIILIYHLPKLILFIQYNLQVITILNVIKIKRSELKRKPAEERTHRAWPKEKLKVAQKPLYLPFFKS